MGQVASETYKRCLDRHAKQIVSQTGMRMHMEQLPLTVLTVMCTADRLLVTCALRFCQPAACVVRIAL